MSSLQVNSVANVGGTKPPNIPRGEFIQVWINFNGSGTVAIRDSMGVASITDTSQGRFSVNYSTAFPNANYSPQGFTEEISTGTTNNINGELNGRVATRLDLSITNAATSAYVDPTGVYGQFVGDYA